LEVRIRKILTGRKLRQHQQDAFYYANRVRHPALFMEMRLGKTLVTIRRCLQYIPLDRERGLRVLVVAPNSALGSWAAELMNEGQDSFEFLRGLKEKRQEMLTAWGVNWYLMNKEGWAVIPEIADKSWDAVIIDESRFLANPKAQVTKFFTKNFRGCPHRWALTGLPNPESELEFFCQMQWLNTKAFGFKSYYHFRNACFEKGWDGFRWQPKVNTTIRIRDHLAEKAFVCRRADVNMDAEKIYETRTLHLPDEMDRIYRRAESEYVLECLEGEKETEWNLVKYSWLRQLACGFIDGEMVWNGKLQELENLLKGELQKEQVVIWFAYNQDGAAISKNFGNIPVLTGENSPEERESTFSAFQRKAHRVIALQMAIAQTGVNLSVADTAIYYSNTPSHDMRAQTEDRILDIGRNVPLLYIDIATADTVDMDVLRALQAKKFKSDVTLTQILRRAIAARINNRSRN